MTDPHAPATAQVVRHSNSWGGTELDNFSGLSKRELFAAMALQGLLSNDVSKGELNEFSEMAVSHADALIAALNEEAK